MKSSRTVSTRATEPVEKALAREGKQVTTPQRRPTQRDIAIATGMSQTAVSLALNDVESSTVSREARARILRAAEKMGYVPNRMARNLQSTRTHTLACVVPDLTNPAYPALIRGFQSAAEAAGYDTMIFDTDGTLEREKRALHWLAQGHVDGVMAVFFHVNEAAVLKAVRTGMPVVQMESQTYRPSKIIDKVYINNAAAVQAMTQLLLGKGHQRIVMLSCHKGPGAERERGFREAMRGAGFPARIIEAEDFTQAAGERAITTALAAGSQFSAVLAANDLLAIGAMAALRVSGKRIPEDVALAGFDDIPAAQLLHPALTTVRRDEQDIGRFVAELLVARLGGSDSDLPGRGFEMTYQLITREST